MIGYRDWSVRNRMGALIDEAASDHLAHTARRSALPARRAARLRRLAALAAMRSGRLALALSAWFDASVAHDPRTGVRIPTPRRG